MRDFAALFLGRRRNRKREVAESVIRDQPYAAQAANTNSKRPPRNPSSPSNHTPNEPVNIFRRQVLRFRKGGKHHQNNRRHHPFNHRVPHKSSTAPIGKAAERPGSKNTNPRHNSLPHETPSVVDRVVTFKEPRDEEQDSHQLGNDANDASIIPKPASPVKKQLAFGDSSPDEDDGDIDDGDAEHEFFANFTRRHADARNDLPSSPASPTHIPSNHLSSQRPVSGLRFARRNRSVIPPASDNSINPAGKPAERFFSDNGMNTKSTFSTHAEAGASTPANQTTDSLDSNQPLLETKVTNEMLKTNSGKTGPDNPVADEEKKNHMRSNSLMSKQNVHDVDLQDLRASLSTPHLSVMKESTAGNSNSFWFAERRKPRSRLLSAFPFRKSSKMFSDYEIPPSIANTPQIPWSVPGAMSDDEDDADAQSANPSISNSFLSFRVFNNLRKNNSYLPPTPFNSQDPFSVIEANYPNGTTENGNMKNGVRSILRFPFGGRRSPVPSAARKEATAAEDGFEKEIAEKNERPSDISLHIPRMDDDETSFKSAVDPHDFDVDEYSSLHSAISAMLTEKSHVVARNEEDEMLMRHDIRLKRPSSKGVLFEQEVPQIRAGVVRYKSTPRENPSACAFSGPVLAFSLLPTRPIEVPPAPLVYGPDSTGWSHEFSDFPDAHGATVRSISLANPSTADLADRTVSPPKTPVLNLRTSKSPSDEALVPGNTSYVRVSSVGMISNESEKRLALIDLGIDPVTRVRSTIVGSDNNPLEASYSIPMRSTNESLDDQGGSHAGLSNQISVPRQSRPVIHSSREAAAYPVAILMDDSQEISAVESIPLESNPPLHTTPTDTADSPNLLVAPTLADVQKLAAETRTRSELQNVLLDSLRPSALPDVVPLADIRSNGGSSLHISGAIPTTSEPTFTTFSETSKDWGGSLEFASDVPSLSSNEMFVDAPSNLFRSTRNGNERLELPHPAELVRPPSQISALKSPPLSAVIQQSKTHERPSRLSKVGIVGHSPWREPKPVPRANTATVLSALPPRPKPIVPTPVTSPKVDYPAPGALETFTPITRETETPGLPKPVVSPRVVLPPFILGTPLPVIQDIASALSNPVASTEDIDMENAGLGVSAAAVSSAVVSHNTADTKEFDKRDSIR